MGGGDSIRVASNLRCVIKTKKAGWYQLKSTTDFTPRGMCFEVATYHRELVKHAHSLCS